MRDGKARREAHLEFVHFTSSIYVALLALQELLGFRVRFICQIVSPLLAGPSTDGRPNTGGLRWRSVFGCRRYCTRSCRTSIRRTSVTCVLWCIVTILTFFRGNAIF
ncbi:hypothetical protein SCHPADRAFT_560436 [Schizopora paradoxa]|uniref:Uncharacterized protein n=1 Tax=Schizopora paradoxa TaxID=27342 RepID=A0A0H2RJD3_9AGAM|nr:hypothetical protein SCHPADRAFT_560436 [Schizopora paradoxa]